MPQPNSEQRPNVVPIMADDLGYGGVSHYGTTHVRTPNIDRISQEGMTFTELTQRCMLRQVGLASLSALRATILKK